MESIITLVFKGIVHPEFFLSVIIYSPSSFNFFLSLNKKDDILKNGVTNKHLMGPDFHIHAK